MKTIKKLFKGNTLYYPGCLTKLVAKDLQENYKKILNKIGISFILLKDLEMCCGNPVLNAGYEKETKELNIKITYHDPCYLGRHNKIYEEPREIIKKSGDLKEMKLTKNYSFCCGGGGGVKSNHQELSNSIAKERIQMAKETKAECLVTSCPMCYLNLKENSTELNVKEISQLFKDESSWIN